MAINTGPEKAAVINFGTPFLVVGPTVDNMEALAKAQVLGLWYSAIGAGATVIGGVIGSPGLIGDHIKEDINLSPEGLINV